MTSVYCRRHHGFQYKHQVTTAKNHPPKLQTSAFEILRLWPTEIVICYMIRCLGKVVSAWFKLEERFCEFFRVQFVAFSKSLLGLAVFYFVRNVIAYFD